MTGCRGEEGTEPIEVGARSRAAAPLLEEELAEVVQASDKDASWAPPLGGFSGHDQLGGDTEADPTR